MNDAFYVAATALHAQQLQLHSISNNLANSTTPGFKKGKVSFQELVYRETGRLAGPDRSVIDGIAGSAASVSAGVHALSIGKSFTAGPLSRTDSPLDVAIEGEGFLEVGLPDGTSAYSRGGNLQVNRDGLLATADGSPLKPGIVLGTADTKNLSILADGRVMLASSPGTDPIEIGRLSTVVFTNPGSLAAMGENLYRATEASGEPLPVRADSDGAGRLAQGYVESSNVDMVSEMVSLMMTQRAYSMSVKMLQATDEVTGLVNNLRK